MKHLPSRDPQSWPEVMEGLFVKIVQAIAIGLFGAAFVVLLMWIVADSQPY